MSGLSTSKFSIPVNQGCVVQMGTINTPVALSCVIFWRHVAIILKGGKA